MNRENNSFIHWRTLASRHPSAFLLAAQLLSLALYAAFDESASRRVLLGAFGILLLPLVMWVINHSPTIQWIAWILVLPALLFALLSLISSSPSLLALSSLLEAVLYFYAAGSLIGYMMGDYRVTTDELYAAGATFTLLAWGFGYAYVVLDIWLPGSLVGGTPPGQTHTFVELLSLSFTNLSATGLGDILAVNAPARVLVMLNQFAGVGYVAVVVSRLIGMTIGQSRDRRAS